MRDLRRSRQAMPEKPKGVPKRKRFSAWIFAIPLVAFLAVVAFNFSGFWDYFGAVKNHWVASMSGAIALAIGFWEKVKGKLDERLFYVIAILCFVFAGFQTWQDERRNYLVEYAKREPELIPSYYESAMSVSKDTGECCFLYEIFSIRNKGGPSITRNWQVSVKTPNEKLWPADIVETPKPVNMFWDTKQSEILRKLKPEDLLPDKTGTNPIATGSEVYGYIYAKVRGATRRDLDVDGLQSIVSFDDVNGKRYIATTKIWQTNPSGMGKYIPGMGSLAKP